MQDNKSKDIILDHLHAFQNCTTCDKCICDEQFEHYNCTWCEMFREIFADVIDKMTEYMQKIM